MYSTSRQVYIDILTELVKEESPTLYLEDYLYYYNKAISEYLKARYELFEVNQQLTDDLRAWKIIYENQGELKIDLDSLGTSTDGHEYRHILSCVVSSVITRPDLRCLNQKINAATSYKATRMSSDLEAGILDNEYLRPEYFRPYYKIVGNMLYIDIGNLPKSSKISTIKIEYLKQPVYVDLTEDEIAIETDTSQKLEFTKDVGDEITKIALKLILEREGNPRMQSNAMVNQSITDMSTGFRSGK